MLYNLIISFMAVFPMFVFMGIGLLVKKLKYIDDEDIKKFNKVVFRVCFGPMIFVNLYGRNLNDVMDSKLIAFTLICIFLLYLSVSVFAHKVTDNKKTQGAMIQAVYRSNFVVMGIPIVSSLFSENDLSITSLLITIVVPIYNILAVVTLEVYRGVRPELKKILISIAKNPLIIGAVLAIATTIIKIRIPDCILDIANNLSAVANPMMMILLGASFSLSNIATCRRNLTYCVIGRLLIAPFIGLTSAALLGFHDAAFGSLIAIFAAPTAISSYTMAQEMESDAELAGAAVIFSSALSCITMFLWIFVFKTVGTI